MYREFLISKYFWGETLFGAREKAVKSTAHRDFTALSHAPNNVSPQKYFDIGNVLLTLSTGMGLLLQVGYEAGSNGEHLPPIYMNSLDDALIPVLNKAAANSADGPIVLELVFKIMEI